MEKGDIITNDLNPSQAEFKSLPPEIKKKIKALKRLHFYYSLEESKYHKEAHELEYNFYKKYQNIFDKRKNIIDGNYEPSEEESQWPSDEEDLADKLENTSLDSKIYDGPGIPNFWLIAMQNSDVLADLIEEHDVLILKYLKDIKVVMSKDPIAFKLEFYFAPNEFFTNSVLTKTYEFKCEVKEDDSLLFEGPEATKCVGTDIDWNPGKNVTVRIVKKRQKHKTTGQTKLVSKTVKSDSFFNFFESQEIPDSDNIDDMAEDLGELLANDVEIGNFIRERLVPRAVYYYTGYYSPVDDDECELSEPEDEDEDDESGGDEDDE